MTDRASFKALEIMRQKYGAQSDEYIGELMHAVELQYKRNDLDAVEKLCLEAVEIARARFGSASDAVAISLSNLGDLFVRKGEESQAAECYAEAFKIQQSVDPHSISTARAILDLTKVLVTLGELDEAAKHYATLLAIEKRRFGENSLEIAGLLSAIGNLHHERGDHAQAAVYLAQALKIVHTTPNASANDIARLSNNLGEQLRRAGDLTASEGMLSQAVKIGRQISSDQPERLALSLSNLASTLIQQHRLDEAERCSAEAVVVMRRASDPAARSELAKFLFKHASILQSMLRIKEAEGIYVETCALLSGEPAEIPLYVSALTALAEVYGHTRQESRVVPILETAVNAVRQTGQLANEGYADLLVQLADAEIAQAHDARAEALLRIAIATCNAIGSETSLPDYAREQLNQLLAEEETEDVMASFANLPGEYVAHLYMLGQMLVSAKAIERGLAILYELVAHCRHDPRHSRTLVQALLFLAESEHQRGIAAAAKNELAEAHFERAESLVDEAMEVHRIRGGAAGLEGPRPDRGDRRAPDRYLERASVLRGLLATARGEREAARAEHAKATELRNRWDSNVSAGQTRAIHNIVAHAAAGAWAAASEALREWTSQDDAHLSGVLSSVDEHQLVEYLQAFYPLLQVAVSIALAPRAGTLIRQQALEMLLRRKGIVTDAMRLRGLATKDTTPLVDEYVTDLSKITVTTVANALSPDRALVEFVRCIVLNLDAVPARGEPANTPPHYVALIMKGGASANVQVIDLGPALEIDRQVFEWLRHMNPPSEAVADESRPKSELGPTLEECLNPDNDWGLVSCMYSGEELRTRILDPITKAMRGVRSLLISPDGSLHVVPFGALPTRDGALGEALDIRLVTTGRDLLRPDASSATKVNPPLVFADPDYDAPGAATFKRPPSAGFTRLPGTREEGTEVAKLLGVPALLDGDASGANLLSAKSPRVLHIATHGFFLPSDEHADLKPEKLLRRSGLALAGANYYRERQSQGNHDTGLFTAADVTSLTLRGTELVVLSACATGLGDIRAGEGVFGLRRAFITAGAASLVVSLWKVPDEATRDLMILFYERLTAGASPSEALVFAQAEIRKIRPHPYYWGAFVCIGDHSITPRRPLSP